jgi:hypothetical protein
MDGHIANAFAASQARATSAAVSRPSRALLQLMDDPSQLKCLLNDWLGSGSRHTRSTAIAQPIPPNYFRTQLDLHLLPIQQHRPEWMRICCTARRLGRDLTKTSNTPQARLKHGNLLLSPDGLAAVADMPQSYCRCARQFEGLSGTFDAGSVVARAKKRGFRFRKLRLFYFPTIAAVQET